jgi:hypothetical protein
MTVEDDKDRFQMTQRLTHGYFLQTRTLISRMEECGMIVREASVLQAFMRNWLYFGDLEA